MKPLIHCQGISHSFPSKKVLNDINFEIQMGETTALVGPNGAGKTTLFSLLCHYLIPDSGEITLLGEKVGSRALLGKIGSLPQDAKLDPRFTIKTQLEFFARLQGFTRQQAKMECLRVLECVDLLETLNLKPTALSHGMSKRVSIAQALIGSPQLILLDEPTAGLDPVNARKIRQLIIALSSQQMSFVISSHNLDELERLCSTVLFLEQGKLTQQLIGPTSQAHLQTLTLLLEKTTTPCLDILNNMQGVKQIQAINAQEFIIIYEDAATLGFDLQLIQTLQQHNLSYRQISKGVSLEHQLFT